VNKLLFYIGLQKKQKLGVHWWLQLGRRERRTHCHETEAIPTISTLTCHKDSHHVIINAVAIAIKFQHDFGSGHSKHNKVSVILLINNEHLKIEI
jgi:hypothetical protein